ncbi:hypothetical protein MIMGU_mgv1a0243422mg, partial [Erythranthe guttata]
INN